MEQPYLSDFPLCDGTIVTDLATNTTYTKEEFDSYINSIASGLLKLGLPASARIGVVGKVGADFLALSMAIYRSRFTMVPINFKVPADQIAYCINDSGCDIIFCDKDLRQLVPPSCHCIEFKSAEFSKILNNGPFTLPKYNKDDIIIIMYTSGTTGKPKGVKLTYGGRIWTITKGQNLKDHAKNETDQVIVHASPLYHLAGLNNVDLSLMYSVYNSNHLVLMPQFNAREYISAIEKYGVTQIKLVSPMMSMILQEMDLIKKHDLSSVTGIVLTSSAAPVKLQNTIKEYFTGVEYIENPYGLTETGPIFNPKHPLGIPRPAGSVGYPLPDVQVRIVDDVLQIKSPSMLADYHNKSQLFSEKMTSDGFFITGDLFRVNKYGFYFYIGRADDMFKSGGEKIYPSEIEVIVDSHPAVALSCVVGVPDEIKGHKPYAFVELKPGADVDPEEVKQYAITRVATYQIPRNVWVLDRLPLTNIGKIDRRALTALAAKLVDEGSTINV